MNRLQKKCFIASAGFHLTLLLILFVGPAFLSKKNPADNMPVLDLIPSKAVDAAMSGGGNPNVKLPPPPTAAHEEVQPPQPKPTPQPPEIVKPEPKEIQKPEPQKIERTEIKPPDSKEKNPFAENKHKIEVSTTIVKRTANKPTTNTKPTDDSEAKAREQAARIAASLRSTARNLRGGLSSATTVEIPGPGGEAYANYEQIVKSIYTQAWIIPDDVTDDEATAKVSVVIARDGTVISAEITKSSGNAAADKSVQFTLNRIKFVAPFPEGAKHKERKFNLSFNVKAKRLLG